MKKYLDISYWEGKDREYDPERHKLDVFGTTETGSPVMIFIHGGTWISGSKDLYEELGENLAGSGITAVLINYRLATDFRKMAFDCAKAVRWVFDNIENYGGDRDRIYLCGHSAGGHLAALISMDPSYFHELNIPNPIKGCVLLDAFGLNIGAYIAVHGAMYMHYISQVFTSDPALWKKASPVNFTAQTDIPFLIYTGSETYPFLLQDNLDFMKQLKVKGIPYTWQDIPGKSHQEMVTQMKDSNNRIYRDIQEFTGILPGNRVSDMAS